MSDDKRPDYGCAIVVAAFMLCWTAVYIARLIIEGSAP